MTLVGVLFFGFLAFGLPVGIVLGVSGLVGLYLMGGGRVFLMVPERMFAGLDIFPFIAMPLFILAGELMNRTGITDSLVRLATSLVGWFRGGLAHSNMIASVLFAGITGSATADAAAFGNTFVPAMVKAGYSRAYACAVTAAGSIIGPTIPPSSIAVVYGSIMSVSIAGLFAAAILPGLLICAACMAVIAVMADREGLPAGTGRPSLREIGHALSKSVGAILLPVFIIGSIVTGVATPTEAAALSVAYALLLGAVVYRSINRDVLYISLVRTARLTGVIFLIIATASILSWWMAFNQIPQMVASAIFAISTDPSVVIALIIVLLLLVGMVMDNSATLLVLVPVLVPILDRVGMDPVHAGIVIILSLNISLMTPPVGACLFVLASVTGEKVEAIARKLWPYILAEVAVLLLVAYWPAVTMSLPRLFDL
ncbi:TRAP transporter large permease [Acuticoccus kandeliae]|uniref:TRAP transporter large permease n=1 Tax=Acuticoccus kandeliae TaxID=2073160 RepID=UPI000D3E60F9|nr:TRAP transporter large permease [Acuticoccus kandeliae]